MAAEIKIIPYQEGFVFTLNKRALAEIRDGSMLESTVIGSAKLTFKFVRDTVFANKEKKSEKKQQKSIDEQKISC